MTTMIRRVTAAMLLMFTASQVNAITIDDQWKFERLPATGGHEIAVGTAILEPLSNSGGMALQPEAIALAAVHEAQLLDGTHATAADHELFAIAGLAAPASPGDSGHVWGVSGIWLHVLPLKSLTLISPSPAIWITLVGLFGFLVIGRKHKLS